MLRKGFKDAADDLRYLLSRGYNREGAVSFVGDKHQLDRTERLVLYRAVYDSKTAEDHCQKKLQIDAVADKVLGVDGYNVIITVESMLMDKLLIICDDGFVRDVSAVHGSHKPTGVTEDALKTILSFLREYRPLRVGFFYDSQVSHSGELASVTRHLLKDHAISGKTEAVKKADTSALKYGEIVASSDAVLIEKAKKLVDLAGELAKRSAQARIVNLREV